MTGAPKSSRLHVIYLEWIEDGGVLDASPQSRADSAEIGGVVHDCCKDDGVIHRYNKSADRGVKCKVFRIAVCKLSLYM